MQQLDSNRDCGTPQRQARPQSFDGRRPGFSQAVPSPTDAPVTINVNVNLTQPRQARPDPTNTPVAVTKGEVRCPCCNSLLPPDSIIPMPSPSFSEVVWVIGGEERHFHFSPLQAKIIRHLWLAWEGRTPVCHIDSLLDACETERGNPSISSLFPRHPAMHVLIVNVGKGLWRLADPS